MKFLAHTLVAISLTLPALANGDETEVIRVKHTVESFIKFMPTVIGSHPRRVGLVSDCDGVLTRYSRPGKGHTDLARGDMPAFVQSLSHQGVRTVISSAWNNLSETKDRLVSLGMQEFLAEQPLPLEPTDISSQYPSLHHRLVAWKSGRVISCRYATRHEPFYRQKAFALDFLYSESNPLDTVVFVDDSGSNLLQFQRDMIHTRWYKTVKKVYIIGIDQICGRLTKHDFRFGMLPPAIKEKQQTQRDQFGRKQPLDALPCSAAAASPAHRRSPLAQSGFWPQGAPAAAASPARPRRLLSQSGYWPQGTTAPLKWAPQQASQAYASPAPARPAAEAVSVEQLGTRLKHAEIVHPKEVSSLAKAAYWNVRTGRGSLESTAQHVPLPNGEASPMPAAAPASAAIPNLWELRRRGLTFSSLKESGVWFGNTGVKPYALALTEEPQQAQPRRALRAGQEDMQANARRPRERGQLSRSCGSTTDTPTKRPRRASLVQSAS